MFHLDNESLRDNPWITIVGCGGTGGFVAEGICRLFQGREATIVLVDHDRVEDHNLLRQNFYEKDVGTLQERGSCRASVAGTSTGQLATRPIHSKSTGAVATGLSTLAYPDMEAT